MPREAFHEAAILPRIKPVVRNRKHTLSLAEATLRQH